jgi:outer membrane protein
MLRALILFGAASIAFPQGKTATINLQQAILSTAEGKSAAARLQAKWDPEIAALGKRDAELKAEREAFERESKRRRGWWPWRREMSAKQKTIEAGKIQEKAKTLQRNRDDDRAAFENERKRMLNELGGKMHALLEDYARDHGYSAISEAATGDDVTRDVVRLYDRVYPVKP